MKKVAEIIKTEKSEGIKIMKKSYLFAGAAALLAVVAGCHFYGQKGEGAGMPAVNVTVAEAKEEVINKRNRSQENISDQSLLLFCDTNFINSQIQPIQQPQFRQYLEYTS